MKRQKIELPAEYEKPKCKGGRKKEIKFGTVLEDSIYNIIRLHNVKFPKNIVALNDAKRIVKKCIDEGGTSEMALMSLNRINNLVNLIPAS